MSDTTQRLCANHDCQISFVLVYIFMVSFTRRVRIAGGRFWCAACNSVNRTCSTSTLLIKTSRIMALPRQIPAVWWWNECPPGETTTLFAQQCARIAADCYIGCALWRWCDCLTTAIRETHERHTHPQPANRTLIASHTRPIEHWLPDACAPDGQMAKFRRLCCFRIFLKVSQSCSEVVDCLNSSTNGRRLHHLLSNLLPNTLLIINSSDNTKMSKTLYDTDITA